MRKDVELNEGWMTVVLLLLMLLCIAWSVQAAQWSEGLFILQEIVLVGGVLGVLLGKSRIPSAMAHFLAALAGFTWAAWLTSYVIAGIYDLPGHLAVVELDLRLQTWVADLVTRGSSSVGSVFLLVLSLLLWLVAYVSAWAVFRWHRVWWAVILTGLAMILNVTATPTRLTVFLVAYLLIALLLVVRTSLASYEFEWRRARVHYGTDLALGFVRAGLLVSVVAIALAWVVPEVVAGDRFQAAMRRVGEPWQRFQEAWSDLFQDLTYRNEPPVIYLSRSSAFGGPVELSDRPVLDIEAPTGRYWRRTAFDSYVSSGWINTDPDSMSLEPNDPRLLQQPLYRMRGVVTQTVTLREDLGMGASLTLAGEPLLVGMQVDAVLSYITQTTSVEEPTPQALLPAELSGVSMLFTRRALPAGTTFTAVSSVSSVSSEALRSSGTGYPDWVTARYLQLPDSLPDRVRDLAQRVAGDLETPYEKVLAIEEYLRKIPYNEQIEGPRQGQDGVDYFLYEAQEGYCQYYASAMVVMLRAVGVPARYVEGYSQSSRQEGVFHVLERDGHAWPEVFFPEYGWVEFEPTASRPLNVHSLPADAAGGTGSEGGAMTPRPTPIMEELQPPARIAPSASRPQALSLWRRIPPWAWAVLGVWLAGVGLSAWLFARHRRRLAGLRMGERVYEDLINWAGRLLRLWPLAHQTPHEYARTVAAAVPDGSQVIEHVADLYVQERFGGKAVFADEAFDTWRRARPLLVRSWWRAKAEAVQRVWKRVAR